MRIQGPKREASLSQIGNQSNHIESHHLSHLIHYFCGYMLGTHTDLLHSHAQPRLEAQFLGGEADEITHLGPHVSWRCFMAQGLIAMDRWIPCDHGTALCAGGARSKWSESGATWRLSVRMLGLVHGWPAMRPSPGANPLRNRYFGEGVTVLILFHWPFQEATVEVSTICKAQISGNIHTIALAKHIV